MKFIDSFIMAYISQRPKLIDKIINLPETKHQIKLYNNKTFNLSSTNSSPSYLAYKEICNYQINHHTGHTIDVRNVKVPPYVVASALLKHFHFAKSPYTNNNKRPRIYIRINHNNKDVYSDNKYRINSLIALVAPNLPLRKYKGVLIHIMARTSDIHDVVHKPVNIIKTFFNTVINPTHIEKLPIRQLYLLFRLWSINKGFTIMSSRKFGRKAEILLHNKYIKARTYINNYDADNWNELVSSMSKNSKYNKLILVNSNRATCLVCTK